jgi:hypothetical protein
VADSFTTNLGLTKPEVGASSNTWGGKTNADWDIVDGIFTSASTTPVAIVLRDDMKFTNVTTTSQQLLLSCAGISAGTQRTLKAPDASGTIALQSVLRGYIDGLAFSNDVGTPNTKIDVSAGVAMDDTNTTMFNMASGVINCGTNGVNGLDTGSLAISTWYHTFAIGTPGAATTAYLASTSLTPSMPATYTLKRRIGSFMTDGSAHILPLSQNGDEFIWPTSHVDFSSGVTGTPVNPALTVPPGVVVWALFRAIAVDGNTGAVTLYSLAESAAAGTSLTGGSGAAGQWQAAGHFNLRTNTSRQIGLYGDATGPIVTITTYGWIDRRGRNA